MISVDLQIFDFQSPLMVNLKNALEKIKGLSVPVHVCGASGVGKSSIVQSILKADLVGGCKDEHFDAAVRTKDFTQFLRALQNGTRNLVIENIDLLTRVEQKALLDYLKRELLPKECRIITTSQKSLLLGCDEHQFITELYFKLSVVRIEVPALKDRLEDLPALCAFLMEVFQIIYNKKLVLSPSAWVKLQSWSWPENLRELESVLERAFVICGGSVVSDNEIQFDYRDHTFKGYLAGMSLSQVERALIDQTLEFTNQNRTRAAEILGISIRTLRNKINEYKSDLKGLNLKSGGVA